VVVSKRNPDETRQRLLQAAFQEIHRNGFRSASLDSILADTGVTKGALYHHFPNKTELGYAIVDELIHDMISNHWLKPLSRAENPIDGMIGALHSYSDEDMREGCELGCPLNNLAQELSTVDEGFRLRLDGIFAMWRRAVADALRRGQRSGYVRKDIDPDQIGCFFVAGMEGGIGLAKTARNPEILIHCRDTMIAYLETLRVPAVEA
jgi:TetR/AcrR family transcriptional repressor of nem operon